MQLKLSRSQRTSGILSKAVLFCLDARLELTAEEAANMRKYGLGSQVIYNSEAARKHIEAVDTAAAEDTARGAFRTLVHAAMSRLSLNITLAGLVGGQHIECKDLDELLGAEEAIMTASRSAHSYLETAKSFDGREIVIDLDAPVEVAA